jgi:hypothetical protein
MATPSEAGKDLAPAWATSDRLAAIGRWLVWLLVAALIAMLAAIPAWLLLGPSILAIVLLGAAAALLAAWAYLRRIVARAGPGSAVRDGRVTPELIREAAPPASFVFTSTADALGRCSRSSARLGQPARPPRALWLRERTTRWPGASLVPDRRTSRPLDRRRQSRG